MHSSRSRDVRPLRLAAASLADAGLSPFRAQFDPVSVGLRRKNRELRDGLRKCY